MNKIAAIIICVGGWLMIWSQVPYSVTTMPGFLVLLGGGLLSAAGAIFAN